MTNQPDSRYFLLDSEHQGVLIDGYDLSVMTAVQRAIIDVRVISIFKNNWQTRLAAAAQGKDFFKIDRDEWKIIPLVVSQQTRDKRRRAQLLAEGFAYLYWMANLAVEFYWTTSSIDLNDLALMSTMKDDFVNALAKSKNIDRALAQKQIDFDEQNLKSLVLRRKEILWSGEQTLLAVDNQDQLLEWKAALHADIFKVGAI